MRFINRKLGNTILGVETKNYPTKQLSINRSTSNSADFHRIQMYLSSEILFDQM